MGLSCRICRHKFSVPLTAEEQPSQDFSISTMKCGHLFHAKCLEASLTHQKLSHARNGIGPFRKMCPAFQCGAVIMQEGDVIKLCVTPEELQVELEEDFEKNDDDDAVRLIKQLQRVALDRDQWKTKAETLGIQKSNLHEALEEIKVECDEMQSFLHDSEVIQKGDRVFWLNPDGTFSPAKVIEIRKKLSNSMPYVVIKLERKKKSGILKERESFIVSANELLTFKSFFKEYFDEFSYKLKIIMSEIFASQSDFLAGKSFRKPLRRRSSAGEIHTGNTVGWQFQSHEAIDQLILERHEEVEEETDPLAATVADNKRQKFALQRRKTVSATSVPAEYYTSRASLNLRFNSHSYPKTSPLSEFSLSSMDSSSGSGSTGYRSVFGSPIRESSRENEQEYIGVGERVIWYDSYCDHPQVGNVAALLQYTNCAIVKFDKLPDGPKQFEYRTVSVQQLFPYHLASVEDKLKISAAYHTDFQDSFDTLQGNLSENDDDQQYDLVFAKVDHNFNDIGSDAEESDFNMENSIARPPTDSSSESSFMSANGNTAYASVAATLFSLFYSTNIFEKSLLDVNLADDEKQRAVKNILTVDVIPFVKNSGKLPEDLAKNLMTTLGYAEDDFIQPQDFLTNLLEDTLKSKFFISFENGTQQNVFNLTIPEYQGDDFNNYDSEENSPRISHLQTIFEMTLNGNGDRLESIPAPALILSVNRPHFSRGNLIVPPATLHLDAIMNSSSDELKECICGKSATWNCRTCVDTTESEDEVKGYCDDCRYIVAEFHKDLDHFPLLSCSKEGNQRKMRLHAVICKSEDISFNSFIKNGMGHSDSWIMCAPQSALGESKIVTVGSIQSWLDHFATELKNTVVVPDEIPPLVLKLLLEGCLFIYCPLSS